MLLRRVPNVCGFVLLSMLVYLEMNLVPPFYSQSPSPLFFCPLVLDLGLATLVQCFVFFLRVLPTHFGIIQFLELFFFRLAVISVYLILCSVVSPRGALKNLTL